MYFVYILYSKQFDRYYIGQTNDTLQRINLHNSAKVPSTASYIPWEPIGYIEKEKPVSGYDSGKETKKSKSA
jgi:putative endonuclease